MKWSELTKKLGKDRFILLFLAGLMCVIIAIPLETGEDIDEKSKQELTFGKQGTETGENLQGLSAGDNNGTYGEENYYGVNRYAAEQYREDLCSRLKIFLQKIDGVGQVEVFITMHSSSEMIVERNSPYTRKSEEEVSDGSSKTMTEMENESQVVLIETEDGSQTPIVVKEIAPSIKGVVVAAQGAGSDSVKNNITEAMQALFGIEEHKIKVVKLNT